jgi:anti-anti-sigma factor
MTTTRTSKTATSIVLPQITDLVRGHEQQLLEWMQPLVTAHNVTLDLANVSRIDAAGLAALITLYCDACKAGHRFAIANPSPHVLEILALVGLDRILLSQNAEEISYPGMELEETAA